MLDFTNQIQMGDIGLINVGVEKREPFGPPLD